MSRLILFLTQPRSALAMLATITAGSVIAVGSGANFTSASANPSNAFSAGTLSQSNSSGSSAILTASDMRPGGSAATGTVDIANTGSLSGTFTLGKSNLTDSSSTYPLSGRIDLVVEDCGVFTGGIAPSCTGATQKFSGKLSALSTVALGSFAGGEKHRYRFSVTLPSATDDNYQGGTTSVQFDWSAAA